MGQKVSLEEALLIGVLGDELGYPNELGQSRIRCPNNCAGTLIEKESRYDYGPYIGCTAKSCNYHTTIKKLNDKINQNQQ